MDSCSNFLFSFLFVSYLLGRPLISWFLCRPLYTNYKGIRDLPTPEKIPCYGEFIQRSDPWAGLIASRGSFYPMVLSHVYWIPRTSYGSFSAFSHDLESSFGIILWFFDSLSICCLVSLNNFCNHCLFSIPLVDL